MSVHHARYSVGKVIGAQVHHVDVDMYLMYCRKGCLVVDMVMEVERVCSRKMELQCVHVCNNHRNVKGTAVMHSCYCDGK